MELGSEALVAQHVWRILLHITPARIRSMASPHGGCRKQHHGLPRCGHCKLGLTRLSGRRPTRRPWQPSKAYLRSSRLAPPPVPARSPPDQARHGLGWQLIPSAGVRTIPVGDLAPASVDASAPRQAKLANELDLEVNRALTASISVISGARPIAVCGRGSVRQGAFRAQSGEGDPRSRRLLGESGTRKCRVTLQPRTCGNSR